MTKFRFYSFILIAILFFNVGILAKSKTQILVIADRMADCTGVAPMKCLQVKRPQDEKWTLFYGAIENFQYIAGYTYVARVAVDTVKNPPADASNLKYRLRKVLHRERTASENQSGNNSGNNTGLSAKAWQLSAIDGASVSAEKAFIKFDETKNSVGGNGGCNGFGGNLVKNGNQIKISEIISTKMFCEATQEIENKFLGNLDRVTKYQIIDGKLLLFAADKIVLEFAAKK